MTRIIANHPGWMCNHIWGWARMMAEIESRQDIDNVSLILVWPDLTSGEILFPKTSTEKLDFGSFVPVEVRDLKTCLGDRIVPNSWDINSDATRVSHHMTTITFRDDVESVVSGIGMPKEFIGVHIRYGNYIPIGIPDETRPRRHSNEYYSNAVEQQLALHPRMPIFLASNGTDDELRWFTDKYSPFRSPPKLHAAVDLCALSKSKILVASASTFSHAASAIGNVPMIWP